MRTININTVTEAAVRAALAVIDLATDQTSKRSEGPCGDRLACHLDETIRLALEEHFTSDDAPAFVRAR